MYFSDLLLVRESGGGCGFESDDGDGEGERDRDGDDSIVWPWFSEWLCLEALFRLDEVPSRVERNISADRSIFETCRHTS